MSVATAKKRKDLEEAIIARDIGTNYHCLQQDTHYH